MVVFLILASGCAGREEKSDLLSLLGVDEEIADASDQETANIYDALTLLKRGEGHFVKKDYQPAADEFERFLELYPFHRMAAFAQYRLGLSYYKQMNTSDRDPGPMGKAIAAFQKVVIQHPNSLYFEEAKEKVASLILRQAENDFNVGLFYFKNEAYPAAIARFNKAFTKQSQGAIAEQSIYYKGLSHFYAGQREEARAAFEQLKANFPGSLYAQKTDSFLSQ